MNETKSEDRFNMCMEILFGGSKDMYSVSIRTPSDDSVYTLAPFSRVLNPFRNPIDFVCLSHVVLLAKSWVKAKSQSLFLLIIFSAEMVFFTFNRAGLGYNYN